VLNQNSGKIDGPKLITLYKNKVKSDGSSLLSGKLKIMAEHATTFPKDNASVLKMATESTATPWDFLLGIESVHDPMLGAAVVGRLIVPSILAKRGMQNHIVGGRRVAADTVRTAREAEHVAAVQKAESSAKAAETAAKQAETDRLAAEELARNNAAAAEAGASRTVQVDVAAARRAEELARNNAAAAEAGASRGAETARQAAAAKAEAERLAPRVLGENEVGAHLQAIPAPEAKPVRAMLDVGTTTEPRPEKNSGVPASERLAESHDPRIDTVEFDLRQHVLDQPEHAGPINRLIEKADHLQKVIDGFNNSATKAKARTALAEVEKHFGALLKTYGVGNAGDAHGLLTKLYAGGKGVTKLGVESVKDFSTAKKPKTNAERTMTAGEKRAEALTKIAEAEKERSAAKALQESKKVAKVKPTTRLKLEGE
jgi:hypothetical protein